MNWLSSVSWLNFDIQNHASEYLLCLLEWFQYSTYDKYDIIIEINILCSYLKIGSIQNYTTDKLNNIQYLNKLPFVYAICYKPLIFLP